MNMRKYSLVSNHDGFLSFTNHLILHTLSSITVFSIKKPTLEPFRPDFVATSKSRLTIIVRSNTCLKTRLDGWWMDSWAHPDHDPEKELLLWQVLAASFNQDILIISSISCHEKEITVKKGVLMDNSSKILLDKETIRLLKFTIIASVSKSETLLVKS